MFARFFAYLLPPPKTIDQLNQELLEAFKSGLNSKIRVLLEVSGINVNTTDPETGSTLLMVAASNPDVELVHVKRLLRLGADAHVTDKMGYNALFYAARARNIALCDLLIKIKVSAGVASGPGKSTPLLEAVKGEHDIIASKLIPLSNLNACDRSGYTALMRASYKGMEDVVASLLRFKADVQLTQAGKRSALTLAAQGGHAKVVMLLMKHVSFGAHKIEALGVACTYKRVAAIEAVLVNMPPRLRGDAIVNIGKNYTGLVADWIELPLTQQKIVAKGQVLDLWPQTMEPERVVRHIKTIQLVCKFPFSTFCRSMQVKTKDGVIISIPEACVKHILSFLIGGKIVEFYVKKEAQEKVVVAVDI